VFEDPSRAVAAVAALMAFGTWFRGTLQPSPSAGKGQGTLGPIDGELEAKRRLAEWGIPTPNERLVRSAEEAAAVFHEMGLPVVLKIASPDIAHKTEIGGVLLNLADDASVRDGFDALMRRARDQVPTAHIDGVIVAPQMAGGVETILGIKRDPIFGPVVVFGLGGVFVEILQDVALRLAPVDRGEALAMIGEIRGHAILDGARGRNPCDIEALADALAKLSQFAAAHADEIEAVDINPFLVLPRGQGGYALDALIVRR